MAVMQEFKCPNCGGAIAFDAQSQKLVCPYCSTEFEVDALKSANEDLGQDEMNWQVNAGQQWQDGEEGTMRSYVCQSCGGEIIGDENTAATSCPYCSNPVVMSGQVSGTLKPDYIIPFKLDKNAAKEGLKNHLNKKFLLPKVFKEENHLDEVKGIYVPFWLFDADADAKIRYRATRVRAWSDSNYNYTETSFYLLLRAGNVTFERVPVDGSTKMPDDLMESVEPFVFADATEFSTAYLAGYLADKYDVDAEQSIDRANQRVKFSTEEAFKNTAVGYTTVTPEQSSVKLSNGEAKYAMYPVWLLNTTYKNEKYTFAMNGQTGKFVGNLPMDVGKFWKWQMILTAGIGAVIYGINWLLQIL
ncbi:MAG: hypothetical protein KBS62_01735 [Oscillospiraceae bacterium]|nr:hypothetical protein [Candidatus Ruminococcus equi]